MGGGGKQETQTQVQKTEFADEQKPYINEIFKQAQAGYQDTKDLRYTGDTFAPTNRLQLQALQDTQNFANTVQGAGDPTAAASQGFNEKVASGYYTDPLNQSFQSVNPEQQLQDAIIAGTDPLKRQLLEEILPGLSSAAIEGGAYGGSKFQELQGRAIRGFEDTVTNQAAQLSYQDLADRRNLDFQDLQNRRGLAPQLFQTEIGAAGAASQLQDQSVAQNLVAANLKQQVGDTRQAYEQADINNLIAAFERRKTEPFTGLDTYANFISGFGNPVNTTGTSTGRVAQTGGFGGAAKGALGGAAAGSVFGGYGAGLGGVLGGLGGYFG